MGNQCASDKHTFDMHLKVIGDEVNKFYELYKTSKILENIKNYWSFDKLEFTDFKTQIINYFDKLKNLIIEKEQNIKELLIIIIKNSSDTITKYVIKTIEELKKKEYMPIILFLTKENEEKKEIKINFDDYKDIEPRLIFFENYTNDMNIFIKKNCSFIIKILQYS